MIFFEKFKLYKGYEQRRKTELEAKIEEAAPAPCFSDDFNDYFLSCLSPTPR